MSLTETTHSPTPDHLQKVHRRRMALFGLVILIAGVAIGAACAVIFIPRPKPFPGPDPAFAALMVAGRLERMLVLAPEQKEKIDQILKTTFDALHKIQEEAKPKIDAQIKQMNEQISAALTDDQRQKWQRELEDFQNRFREGWRRGGGRPGEEGPGRRRGPGDPNRYPGGPDDANRPPRGGFDRGPMQDRFRGDRGPGRQPDDPNGPRGGPEFFGPQRRPGDPNRPQNGFGDDPMSDRFRRGPGSFGPPPDRSAPNSPPDDTNHPPIDDPISRDDIPYRP
jgi:gas vesicle protein